MVFILKAALGLLASFFSFFYIKDVIRNRKTLSDKPYPGLLGIGFLTNFLDTLGIGSFAQQTSLFKFFKLVDDRLIPGTMNVGDTIPTVVLAFIFMTSEAIGLTGWKLVQGLSKKMHTTARLLSRLPLQVRQAYF